MLDAIMECDFSARQQLSHVCDRGLPCPPAGQIAIPMMRKDAAGFLVACCSSPILGPVFDERQEYYAKRFGVEYSGLLHESARTVMAVGNGTYKASRLPNQVRNVECVAWFCVASGHDMRKWCKRVKAIGKDRSQGYGKVHRWSVEDAEGDYSWFANNVLMRPLPVAAVPKWTLGTQAAFTACQPPYWHPERFTEVMVPC